MTLIKRIVLVLILIPVLLLVVPFLLLFAIPLLIVVEIGRVISLRAFRRREAGHVYLICTSRQNWHDFLRNNVIPVLPDHFRVVWQHRSSRVAKSKDVALFDHFGRSRIWNVPKPYLVAVTRRALVHASLNAVLQELKGHAKRSEETREACLRIVLDAEKTLWAGIAAAQPDHGV